MGKMAFPRPNFNNRKALIRIRSGQRSEPDQELGRQQGSEVAAQGWRRDEITLGSDAGTACSVVAMLLLVESQIHEP